MVNKISLLEVWIVGLLIFGTNQACVHNHFSRNASRHFLHDLTDHRLLANETIGRYPITKAESEFTPTTRR